ncbi:MAG: ceramidase domain-containing protein [Planctomycetes bacterium]|nr:ceramidase domain-containing protein [Planctomycetota bacterium]
MAVFQSVRVRVALFSIFSLVLIGGFFVLWAPIPQPQVYHDFADQRPLAGLPHSLNVLSNLPFVLVGVAGLAYLARRPSVFVDESERWPYWVYFIGLTWTGIGSAYYHANPNNATLVWDRLPLTVAFMGLFTAILAERIHPGCANWLLGPLVVLGAASVFYWDWTERHAIGDLRPYFVVQYFPLIALPFLLLLYPPRYTRTADLLASLLCYGLAKLCELLDREFYSVGALVSGHTVKHLIAGLAAAFILLMLVRRQPRPAPAVLQM